MSLSNQAVTGWCCLQQETRQGHDNSRGHRNHLFSALNFTNRLWRIDAFDQKPKHRRGRPESIKDHS